MYEAVKSKLGGDYFIFLLYCVHILLNFLGTPFLKFYFIFEVVCFFYLAFKKNWQDLVFTTFVFIMIEGQGRILGGYNIIFKNLFDIYLIVILFRSFIKNKNFFSYKRMPKLFFALIIGHFVWYGVQFFNYQSVGPLGPLFSTKIYIFPILFFFLYLNDEVDFDKYKQNKYSCMLLIVLALQAYLVIFQKEMGESQLLGIHHYYAKPMKDVFIDSLFRPFGTTNLPGAPSVYIPYFMSFIYFFSTNNLLVRVLKLVTIMILLFAFLIMQVRTGLLQFILVIFFSSIYISMRSKFKYFIVPGIFSLLFLIPPALNNLDSLDDAFPDLRLGIGIQRLKALKEKKNILGQRSGIELFSSTLKNKLTMTPMGLGPGRTGAANIPFSSRIEGDLAFGKAYSWTLDNLFISLAIDFGYGMIFYSLLIILLPIYIIGSTFYLYFKRQIVSPVLGASAMATGVILVSTWGAISIPYNPISFFFWFFCKWTFGYKRC